MIEDGSAKDSMSPIVVKDGQQKQLGRENLDITNNSISREHCMINKVKNRYYISDTHSKNGTFLNGTRLLPGSENTVEVGEGDRIRFADLWTRLVFI